MQEKFSVEIVSFQKISEIENAWSADDYKALLSLMGLDDGFDAMNPGELKEMCLMSLNDFEPDEAAKFVLTYLFKEEITEGKIDQLSHQMSETRLWEESSDYLFHKRLFDAYGLLREAFNGIFSQPTGVEFTVNITSQNKDGFNVFEKSPHAALVRLLSCGLDAGEILNRLYAEQIAGDMFEESKGILWVLIDVSHSDQELKYKVISSEFWLGRLADVSQFEAHTHADTSDDTKNEL
ncbi:MAG: hypothetical protein Q7U40_04815 [Desulfatirhabdiaceae bacterium]|nr:hypothetical protein [Desulfatirhabdiaceae bacterium]